MKGEAIISSGCKYDHDNIDIGRCIHNDSPYQTTFCKCYKYPIPYKFFDKSGVLLLCKGWIDYVMLYSDDFLRFDVVREAICKKLISLYPEYDNDKIQMIRPYHYIGEKKGLQGIKFMVTPRPFSIYVSIMPSDFIEMIPYEECSTWEFTNYYAGTEYPHQLQIKLDKKMYEVLHYNKKQISDYINYNKGRFKKYEKIIEDLITKINKQ